MTIIISLVVIIIVITPMSSLLNHVNTRLLACVGQTLRTSLASARSFSVHVSYGMPQLHNWCKVCRPQPHPTPSILALRLSSRLKIKDKAFTKIQIAVKRLNSLVKTITIIQ